jgi:polysaccharide biosynthesis PFTS motif protein
VEDNPSYYVIFKEKKPRQWYGREDSLVYAPFHRDYFAVLEKLREHERVYSTGPNGDPAEMIMLADFVITYAFSSTTNEALGARKKAIFYDPTGDLKGAFYEDIPNLVAYEYDQLNALTKKWLYEISDREKEEFQEKYIRDAIDNHLDGKALQRFKELLIAG